MMSGEMSIPTVWVIIALNSQLERLDREQKRLLEITMPVAEFIERETALIALVEAYRKVVEHLGSGTNAE